MSFFTLIITNLYGPNIFGFVATLECSQLTRSCSQSSWSSPSSYQLQTAPQLEEGLLCSGPLSTQGLISLGLVSDLCMVSQPLWAHGAAVLLCSADTDSCSHVVISCFCLLFQTEPWALGGGSTAYVFSLGLNVLPSLVSHSLPSYVSLCPSPSTTNRRFSDEN